jgi:putative Mg2+ transporter-C (MgtC) family protein
VAPRLAPDLALWEGMIRLGLAALLAGAIGVERELREQEAGLRTHMLVCVGATMFMIVGVYGWSDFQLSNNIGGVVDPSRVASYVVSGIGFLGAGAIIRHGINVRGLTTAASLWVVAAIGVAVGVGMYEFALATTAIVILALWPLRAVKDALEGRRTDAKRLAVMLAPGTSLVSALAAIEESGYEMASLEVAEEEDVRRLDVVLETAADAELGALLDGLGSLEGVRSASLSE